jgi:ribose/xylose/arabinose/galactoside ABC-type transport system permease subunit
MNSTEQPQNIFRDNNLLPLPNATASLVLGILSIVFCVTYGTIGIILGIIGLVLANKDRKLYQSNPEAYSIDSYKNSNAGRTCSIIGLVLSGLFFLFAIAIFTFVLSMSTFPFFPVK